MLTTVAKYKILPEFVQHVMQDVTAHDHKTVISSRTTQKAGTLKKEILNMIFMSPANHKAGINF